MVVFLLLKFAIADFLADREYKNISTATISTYKFTLQEFHSYCVENEIIDADDVTGSTIKDYLLYCLHERSNNPTTRNTKLRTLKAFFNYLFDSEIIKSNPVKKVGFAKQEVKIEVCTDQQIGQMLNYYKRKKTRYRSFYSYREYFMIVFLLGTGVRLSEMLNLKWSDIDLINGVISVFGKKREISSIPISNKLKKEFLEYQLFCKLTFAENELKYVFVTIDNTPLRPDTIKNIFKRLSKTMNFNDVRLSAHTFRHTFAHHCLMNGMDVFTLQKLLRHTDLSMTQRYLALWGTALKEQNDKYNPLNNIEL